MREPSDAAILALARIFCLYGDTGFSWDDPLDSSYANTEEDRAGILSDCRRALRSAYDIDAPGPARAAPPITVTADHDVFEWVAQQPSESAFHAAINVMWPEPKEIGDTVTGIRIMALQMALEAAYAVDFPLAGSGPQTPDAPTLEALMREALAWQAATFPHRTLHSISTHLLREATELREHPSDASEMADVFLLLGSLAHENGVNLAQAVAEKLAKNKARQWGTPDSDGVVSHVPSVPRSSGPQTPDGCASRGNADDCSDYGETVRRRTLWRICELAGGNPDDEDWDTEEAIADRIIAVPRSSGAPAEDTDA